MHAGSAGGAAGGRSVTYFARPDAVLRTGMVTSSLQMEHIAIRNISRPAANQKKDWAAYVILVS
jgi:hypothetical protein